MSGIGARHSGTAGGALRPGGTPVSVEIRLGADAFRAPVQHTAWMLLNMLCRLQGAVSVVRLNCPPEIDLRTKLSPLITTGEKLADALVSGAPAIGSPQDGFAAVELSGEYSSDVVVSVGFEFCAEATFCAVGNGLCGGVFSRPIALPPAFSDLTVGPYIGACLAAGEIFRLVRLHSYIPERQLFLSALDYSHGTDPEWSDLEIVSELRSTLLVGVGAVGSALLHTLYPLPVGGTIRLADNDVKGIDDTNLGRYSLFGWASLGKLKASKAAELLRRAEFQTIPHDGSFEHFFAGADKPQIVLSAVDTNGARHALQEQYAPLLLSASTHNLRAELLRCGPPSAGACLACFNPLETKRRTEDEIRALLEERPEVAAKLCEKLKLDPNEVAAWIRQRRCSETGDRLVEELRTEDGSVAAFAVGFVSVLAGTLLAAELLKTISGSLGPLNEARNRAVFQFQNPAAASNTSQFYVRDERCTACSPENVGAQIWKRRYAAFIGAEDPIRR
jgi:molybdopterin/thiamine biosynthesis adenylyltransferase